jgi:hypothetical protein
VLCDPLIREHLKTRNIALCSFTKPPPDPWVPGFDSERPAQAPA